MADSPIRLGELYESVFRTLQEAGIESARLDARLLVQEATGASHADLLARPESAVDAPAAGQVRQWTARRLAGEPVFRILGWREFYGLRLRLGPEVLEPRPDTEALVDLALPLLRQAVARTGSARLLDLGCGSGAIALALLAQEAGAEAVGVDLSAAALDVARRNAAENGLSARFTALQSDWFANVSGHFDLIVSNPPYVATGEIGGLQPEVRLHDPRLALDGGPDGLDAYRKIAQRALEFLAGQGHVVVEIGAGQAESVIAIFARAGFALVQQRRDLTGMERSLAFRPV